MAETIDEARIIAWIDGELDPEEAAEVAARVAGDPALTALAERHRQMRLRFAAAFGPIAERPAELRPPAPVISLAAVRAEREEKRKAAAPPKRWAWPGAIAASLLLGLLVGQQALGPRAVSDRPNALALDGTIAAALDGQLSGDAGPVRVALSFRDKQGDYCRSFAGRSLSGVACRDKDGWTLRYGGQGAAATGDYRMAGADEALATAVGGMIAGEPLDRAGEAAARRKNWR